MDAKFRENKDPRELAQSLSFTDVGKSSFYFSNMSFNAIRENKILAKMYEFTVF